MNPARASARPTWMSGATSSWWPTMARLRLTPMGLDAHVAACWELDLGRAGFCASLANGRDRCRKGTCSLTEPWPVHEFVPGADDGQGRTTCGGCRQLWEHPAHGHSQKKAASPPAGS